MKRWAVVRYKNDTVRGSVFRSQERREHYCYLQNNGQESYDDFNRSDVIWFDDKADAEAALPVLAEKNAGVYFCLVENQAIVQNTVVTTKINKSKFTEKGLLPA